MAWVASAYTAKACWEKITWCEEVTKLRAANSRTSLEPFPKVIRSLPIAKARGQCLLQGKTAAVRIAADVRAPSPDRGAGAWSRTERVFVRGQLYRLGDPILPRQLRERLAGLVGIERAHAGRGQRKKIDGVTLPIFMGCASRRLQKQHRQNILDIYCPIGLFGAQSPKKRRFLQPK